ncbi:MAG: hypothetical protein U1E76_23505, partial [Planctomycetota bacterium]
MRRIEQRLLCLELAALGGELAEVLTQLPQSAIVVVDLRGYLGQLLLDRGKRGLGRRRLELLSLFLDGLPFSLERRFLLLEVGYLRTRLAVDRVARRSLALADVTTILDLV